MLLKACIGVLCCRESKYTVLVTSSSIRQKTSEMGQLPVCIWVLMFTTPQMWMVRVHWRCIYRKLFLRGQAREINKSMLSVRSSYLKSTACAHLKACCFPRYSVGYHAFSLIWKGIGVQFGKATYGHERPCFCKWYTRQEAAKVPSSQSAKETMHCMWLSELPEFASRGVTLRFKCLYLFWGLTCRFT